MARPKKSDVEKPKEGATLQIDVESFVRTRDSVSSSSLPLSLCFFILVDMLRDMRHFAHAPCAQCSSPPTTQYILIGGRQRSNHRRASTSVSNVSPTSRDHDRRASRRSPYHDPYPTTRLYCLLSTASTQHHHHHLCASCSTRHNATNTNGH
jgi:ABC-type nickel/cobalt efflux system permease component RcnA